MLNLPDRGLRDEGLFEVRCNARTLGVVCVWSGGAFKYRYVGEGPVHIHTYIDTYIILSQITTYRPEALGWSLKQKSESTSCLDFVIELVAISQFRVVCLFVSLKADLIIKSIPCCILYLVSCICTCTVEPLV